MPPAAGADDALGTVVRRAPFSDKPQVGPRGQRTQQRILDAALQVFGEEGYHPCSIERITKRAGCSRASFYQYFSSKEDVFQRLTGQVARQLDASTESLGTLTPDGDGWTALRAWVGRHSDIHRRYQPIFTAFEAASELEEDVVTGSARWSDRSLGRMRARLSTTIITPRQVDIVLALLLQMVTRTHEMGSILRAAAPDGVAPTAYSGERVDDALADVIHRSLFGLDPEVNVHNHDALAPVPLEFDPALRAAFSHSGGAAELTPTGQQTLTALLDAGREMFTRRGYHRTRVDDIVEHAGVSHGAFYRYFDNKDQLARILTTRAMRTVSIVLADVPSYDALEGPEGRQLLRRWLRQYNTTQVNEASILRVWVDAALQDTTLRDNWAPALDWGRRNMVAFLEPRDFGDIETEALALEGLLSAFGAAQGSVTPVDAAVHVIEHGFLGKVDPSNGS